MNRFVFFFSILTFVLLVGCSGSRGINTLVQMPSTAANDSFLLKLLQQYPQYFDTLIQRKDEYRIKIIYTQINRRADGTPQFRHYFFNNKEDQYFYPASTIKLPLAALALEKLNDLKVAGLSRETAMITESAGPRLTAVYNDPTTANGQPSVANYIKKILLVSDNDAANRLYEFLGQEWTNKRLHSQGYDDVQLLHRLGIGLTETENRTSNAIRFVDTTGKTIYEQPEVLSRMTYAARNTKLGRGYMRGDQKIEEPFDFSAKNRLQLTDLHSVVLSIIFPDALPNKSRLNLSSDDYHFLRRYMSMLPGESVYPSYDSTHSDAYVKFLYYGGVGNIENSSLRIFNKVGDAYGFLTDAAYIVDFDKSIEFFLSATIYCNSDGIFNDDKYDYNTVGFPFLKNLGQVIYNYEAARVKKVLPDLSQFRYNYTAQ